MRQVAEKGAKHGGQGEVQASRRPARLYGGERARLQRDIARPTLTYRRPRPAHGYGNHMADDATDVFEQARNVAGSEISNCCCARCRMRAALDEGRYGICRRCGRPIDLARLRAQPRPPCAWPARPTRNVDRAIADERSLP